jgi:transposase-like protein
MSSITDHYGSSQQVKPSDDLAEQARLIAELNRVEEERDMLKKAQTQKPHQWAGVLCR